MSRSMIEAIAVTCELTSTSLSEAAIRVMVESLSEYPEAQVLVALRKCCKKLKGRLNLAEILSRLDDGRPGAEEAWSIVADSLNNEDVTIVWTEEIRIASQVTRPLQDNPVAARLAFKERYVALVSAARDRKEPVAWSVSLGYDLNGRELALKLAVEHGRITQETAYKLCPQLPPPCVDVMKLIEGSR